MQSDPPDRAGASVHFRPTLPRAPCRRSSQLGAHARTTEGRTTTYRAYTRATLSELATAVGLQDVRWHMPVETDFFQPVMTARSPT